MHPDLINVEEAVFFYSSIADEKKLAAREKKAETVLSNSDGDRYTGEWIKGTQTRQGKGTMVKKNGQQYDGFFF